MYYNRKVTVLALAHSVFFKFSLKVLFDVKRYASVIGLCAYHSYKVSFLPNHVKLLAVKCHFHKILLLILA